MTLKLTSRASRLVFASLALGGFVVAACADDENPATPVRNSPPVNAVDAGNGNGERDGRSGPTDGGTDAASNGDACADGGCAPASGCELFPNASFCDDFDNADALTTGKSKWDFLEPTEQPVLTLSTDKAVSAPNALLTRVIDGDTPGAKFAKTVTKANFTEVTWAYDVYFESIGSEDGFFLDDFQFSDAAGADTFGFRLVMFARAGAIDALKVEHNQNIISSDYIIEPSLPAEAVALGRWHHFEQTVKFTFDPEGDAGAHKVEYTLRIDEAATPTFQKEYPSGSREQIAFARVAGMPLVFRKDLSAGLKIHWDNHVLDLK